MVEYTKGNGVKRIAISTNGSADYEYYLELAGAGVNDFSISLDSCCALTGHKMMGRKNIFSKVLSNIKSLSKISYVTVGVVLTEDNYWELSDIITFASELGVSDIRVIPAAQVGKKLDNFYVEPTLRDKHPILRYRFNNFINGWSVRGLSEEDNRQCPLVLDDMAVLNGQHYPCIIYLREHGSPIGKINRSIKTVRTKRLEWFKGHNSFDDPICRDNCLDVCIDYNNRVRELMCGRLKHEKGLR